MFSLSLSILEDKMKKEYNKEEYNKLCAEFMGYKLVTPEMRKHPEEWISSYWENPDFNGSSKGVLCSENGLQYNTNWNWIMEVVDTIPQKVQGINVSIHPNSCLITDTGVRGQLSLNASKNIVKVLDAPTRKEAVIQAIWEFLNWYKDNK
jgi:hypothetical protein